MIIYYICYLRNKPIPIHSSLAWWKHHSECIGQEDKEHLFLVAIQELQFHSRRVKPPVFPIHPSRMWKKLNSRWVYPRDQVCLQTCKKIKNNTNPRQGEKGKSISKLATINNPKCVVFNKNLWDKQTNTNKQKTEKCDPYMKQQKQ